MIGGKKMEKGQKEQKPYERSKNCTCGVPKDEFPFADEVFEYLHKVRDYIKKYAAQYDVPVVAVAGAIADEYNTRFPLNALGQKNFSHAIKLGIKKPADFVQDKIIPAPICERDLSTSEKLICTPSKYEEEINIRIALGYKELVKIDPNNENRPKSTDALKFFLAGSVSKFLDFKNNIRNMIKNFTIWSDYGASNISLRTAIDLYEEYNKTFINQNYSYIEMLRHLVSDEGNAQFTAISILDAKKKMGDLIANMPEEKQEAILVTFFKQGIKYRRKYEENKKSHPNAVIGSGEGCRTCFQRRRIIDSLKDKETKKT